MRIFKTRPFHVAAFVFTVLLIVGIVTFAGPCVHEDGSAAVCQGAAHAVVVAGVVACISTLVSLIVRSLKVSGVCVLVAACCGAFAVIAPGVLFGMCMMQTMHCWTVMRPFTLVCGAALLLCAVIAAARSFALARRSAS